MPTHSCHQSPPIPLDYSSCLQIGIGKLFADFHNPLPTNEDITLIGVFPGRVDDIDIDERRNAVFLALGNSNIDVAGVEPGIGFGLGQTSVQTEYIKRTRSTP